MTNWAVNRLLTEEDIFLISGAGGIGKSYVMIDLAISLAVGGRWFNHFSITKAYNVLYIDSEMSENALKRRFARMLKGKKFSEEDEYPYRLLAVPEGKLRLDGSMDLGPLREAIDKNEINFVLIDSVRRTIRGDENDSRVANLLFENVKALRDEFSTAFGFITHWNKPGPQEIRGHNDRVRGSSDWVNMADAHIAVEKGPREDTLLLTSSKTRHGDDLPQFVVKFEHDDRMDEDSPFRLVFDQASMSGNPVAVLHALVGKGQATMAELADETNMSRKALRIAIDNLMGTGRIRVKAVVARGAKVYELA